MSSSLLSESGSKNVAGRPFSAPPTHGSLGSDHVHVPTCLTHGLFAWGASSSSFDSSSQSPLLITGTGTTTTTTSRATPPREAAMAGQTALSSFLPLVQAWLDEVSKWWLGALQGVTWSDAAIFTVRAVRAWAAMRAAQLGGLRDSPLLCRIVRAQTETREEADTHQAAHHTLHRRPPEPRPWH